MFRIGYMFFNLTIVALASVGRSGEHLKSSRYGPSIEADVSARAISHGLPNEREWDEMLISLIGLLEIINIDAMLQHQVKSNLTT